MSDLNLTPIQKERLKALAGCRYNKNKDTLKITCEDFSSRMENVRNCLEMLDECLEEVKNEEKYAAVELQEPPIIPPKKRILRKYVVPWVTEQMNEDEEFQQRSAPIKRKVYHDGEIIDRVDPATYETFLDVTDEDIMMAYEDIKKERKRK